MRARLFSVVAALALLPACGGQFKPETLVDALRVLALAAEPPEIHPGQETSLSILRADPSRPGGATTVIWVGCEPDPLDLGRGPCNNASVLLTPSTITTYPPGLKLLGFGDRATYLPAATTFDVLAPDDPIRQNGSVGQILAVVIGEDVKPQYTDEELQALFGRIERKEIQTLIGITRVLVSERATLNTTPKLDGFLVDGVGPPRGARLQLEAGRAASLSVSVPEAAKERYVLQQPSGPVEHTEVLVGAWYSSSGRFDQARFDLDSKTPTVFTPPGSSAVPDDPVPERRTGTVWLVLRDNRGGESWAEFPFYVCDKSLPAPRVTTVTRPQNAGEPVVVRGENLPSALDVVIGGAALRDGAYSQVANTFAGGEPVLSAGTYPVRLRGKDCSDQDTGLTYTVP